MAKPLTRTSVLDEVPIDAKPEVRMDRHSLDWNTLAEDVAERIDMALKQEATGCRYFNPAVTVTCLQPSPEFWRIVRKEQARWCRQAGKTIPRRNRRSASRWTGDGQWISSKYARFLDRALSFTGVLCIDGRLLSTHERAALPGYVRNSSSRSQ
jgi:hypothetical protein